MKQYIHISLVICLWFLFLGCTIPYTKHVTNLNINYLDRGRRVTITDKGFSLLFPYFIISNPASISSLLFDLKSRYDCKEIQNIEVDYYQTYYLLFGVPKVMVVVDCMK